MIYDRRIALVVRVCFTLIILIGLLSYTGVFEGAFRPGELMYYTIQSNILALVLFAGLSIRTVVGFRREGTKGSSSYAPRFEMVCSINLLLTALVYWILLVPAAFTMGATDTLFSFGNLMVHLVTPLSCLVDWILFARRRVLKFRDTLYVLIFPYCYILFSAIAGALGYVYRYTSSGQAMHAPYPFLEWETLGAQVFLFIAGLSLFFFGMSCLLYLFDRKVKKPHLFKGVQSN